MTTETAEKIAFSAEISKVLKLMIHSLYTNKDIFLRELISNASDACDKLRYQSQQGSVSAEGELAITLWADEKARTLTIRDTGIGMNREDLINNLGTIAKSGTAEFVEVASRQSSVASKDGSSIAENLIGQFGVGFYSSFMVAEKVVVRSRKAGESIVWQWESTGEGDFTVEEVHASDFAVGTEITLYLRKEEKIYTDKHHLSFIVQTYSDHIGFPIYWRNEKGEQEKLNSAAALWARPASEVTKEQYQDFYRHVAHQPDEPWMTLHNRMEGKISYSNLLFIPSMKPFDLFTPERRRRVKLYVTRIHYRRKCGSHPRMVAVLRGVVDSEDLPLNISRETLQHNPLLEKIRESLVKKILGELKKKAEKEPESYQKFWDNFGAVLKEGLCETIAPKEKILEVCQFYSTAKDGYTTLDKYMETMKPEQEAIYYLIGDRLETLRHHPQIEGFRKQGIEVLLFTDHVDDFWVNVVHEYKGKALKSVTKASADLDKHTAEKPEETAEKVTSLIPLLKEIYGEAVRDVRPTQKLDESPVCLAVGEGDMDIRMERFLRENKQLPNTAYAKILEINPSHPVIQAMEGKAISGKSAELEDIAWLLLDQARIIEGEEISDPAAFSRRLTQFLTKGLMAA